MTRKEQTISSILQELASVFEGVVPERDVLDRVLERRPSSAKNPYAAIRQQIRYDGSGVGWVGLGNGELMPLRSALQGLRFRLILSVQEHARGSLALPSMRPFVDSRQQIAQVLAADGTPIRFSEAELDGNDLLFTTTMPALGVADWLQTVGAVAGDSVLITVAQFEPFTLQLEHEPAAAFRADDVAAQDHELLEAMVAVTSRNRNSPMLAEMVVLPFYARAVWRTSYPGRPWQQLVEQDQRVRLAAGGMIADASFRSPFKLFDNSGNTMNEDAEAELLQHITALQQELRNSRRSAVERGLWDGMAPRVSTAQTLFDLEEGRSTTIYPGAVDALEDHTDAIEEHIANGDYEEEDDWESDEGLIAGEEDFDGLDELNELEIDDVQAFVEQNPEVAAATRRLMESLTPEEQHRLDGARSIEDVQQVLGPHLAELLRTEPALFVPLTPDMYESIQLDSQNGYHDGNGNNHSGNHDQLAREDWVDASETLGRDDEWISDAEFEEDEDQDAAFFSPDGSVEAAVERSSELLDQFIESQVRAGKARTTATGRAGDLWLYADFLSRYYGRALDHGDYATLDECLFFFYPRKVLNSSPRNAREFCTSAKQFYAFLKSERVITDDGFAAAIWQRRDQAARVIELYDQIDGDSPQFERLFAHLFAPYTA